MSWGDGETVFYACWQGPNSLTDHIKASTPGLWLGWPDTTIKGIDPAAVRDVDDPHTFMLAGRKDAEAFITGLLAHCARLDRVLLNSFGPLPVTNERLSSLTWSGA